MNAKNLEVMTLTNNLANKKSNDNMKSFFSKYIKLIALILLSTVGVAQAWAADVTFTMASVFDGTSQSATVTSPVNATIKTTTSKGNADDGKLGSDGNYFEVVLTGGDVFSAVSFNGFINTTNTSKNWAFQFSTDGGSTWSAEVTQANDGDKTAHDIIVGVSIPANANGFRVVRRAGTSATVKSITLSLVAAEPDPEPETYSITYDCDGADSGCPEIASGQTALPNPLPSAPTKSGYTFDGWFTNADKTEAAVAGATLTANTTLYAKWTAVATPDPGCTANAVTVESNNDAWGTVVAAANSLCEDETTKITATPASGYRFVSWTVNGTDSSLSSTSSNPTTLTMGTEAVTVTATFEAIPTYTVTFNANGHGSAPTAQSVEDGSTATEPAAPTVDGFTFGGWYTDEECTNAFNFSTKISANITLYAKWTENPVVPSGTLPKCGTILIDFSDSQWSGITTICGSQNEET